MIKFKNSRKIIFAIIFIAAVIGFGIFAKNAANKQVSLESANASIPEKAKVNVASSALSKVQKSDIVLGNSEAPVTMIEYASLSCPHCAAFYSDGFSTIKSEYIETGKVKFIYRDFPLNQPALTAAAVALCHYQNHKDAAKYHDFVRALFRTQESWAFTPEYAAKIATIAKLDGMDDEQYEKCINNKAIAEKILKERLEASKSLNIQSTPSFIINGELISGFSNVEGLKKVIDQKLAQK